MAIREDLVSSAVTFLQDPSVAAAPIDKRVAFLQSKNLTPEEVDASLARAGDVPGPAPQQASNAYPNQQLMRQPPSQYGYNQYQGGYWHQQAPPEIPRRDWRDYFIMATLMSGLSYGVYFVAKRYIMPIIAPPTPPQLEQDKSAIDEAFNRAFTLIEQLSEDTAEIKASEANRKERLDEALGEFEQTIKELKDASRRRDDDTRRISDEVRGLQSMIPKAMKAQEDSSDQRLRELNGELKSLKTLISNRMGGGVAVAPKQAPQVNGYGGQSVPAPAQSGASTPTSAANTIDPSNEKSAGTTNPLNRFQSGRGGIPAWQMAASKKLEDNDASKVDTSDSGTAVDSSSAS